MTSDRCIPLTWIYNYNTSVFRLIGDITNHIPLIVFACRKLDLIKVHYEQRCLYQLWLVCWKMVSWWYFGIKHVTHNPTSPYVLCVSINDWTLKWKEHFSTANSWHDSATRWHISSTNLIHTQSNPSATISYPLQQCCRGTAHSQYIYINVKTLECLFPHH